MVGTVGEFARRQDLQVEGISMTLGREDFQHPTRVGRISARLEITGDISDEDLDRLGRVADRCKVHQTLTADTEPEIDTQVVRAG